VEAVVDVGLRQVEHNRLEEHQAAGRQVDSALAEMQKLVEALAVAVAVGGVAVALHRTIQVIVTMMMTAVGVEVHTRTRL
jgi:hypothetical protein